MRKEDQGFDEALRKTQIGIEAALRSDANLVHYSSGESVETGLWSLLKLSSEERLTDRVEVAVVNFLQKNPDSIFLEIEDDLYPRFPGLLTPSKGMVYAVLNSYAEKDGASWKLRGEDVASTRRKEINQMRMLIDKIGKRLEYHTHQQDKLLIWDEKGKVVRVFSVLASALVQHAIAEISYPPEQTLLVIPGGRARRSLHIKPSGILRWRGD